MEHLQADVLIFGDEVESLLTAVSAARTGVKVIVIRRSMGMLGGLSTRGGLSYMDITPDYQSPVFKEFTGKVGVQRVALEPRRAHKLLEDMLVEAGVKVLSGCTYKVFEKDGGWFATPYMETGETVGARMLIDATPDADVARSLKVPFIRGLGELIAPGQEYLGVSPVFQLRGVSTDELQRFEKSLREKPETRKLLDSALPFHAPELRDEYITRETICEQDYLDILNPVIGMYYHLWRHGEVSSYPQAFAAIDGANIARLPDALSLNGLVFQMGKRFSDEACFEALLAYSHGAAVPEYMEAEMLLFERFLKEEGGLKKARVIPPEELYVRQTLTLLAKHNMTAADAIRGGVPKEKAIGTFSYWLDMRGVQTAAKYANEQLPKPVFNVGLDVALPVMPTLENFAFVSRSAGYSPVGQGAGRIVQHNVMLGEAIGIAAALGVLTKQPLSVMAEKGIAQIRDVLEHRNGGPIAYEGRAVWDEAQMALSKLLAADSEITADLREDVTSAV